jgi:uncharacterized protein with ATP-grasp and redox domains
MQVTAGCISCLFRQWSSMAARLFSAPEQQLEAVRKIIDCLAQTGIAGSPPQIARIGYDILSAMSGTADPFLDIKRKSNAMALDIRAAAEALIAGSDDRLHAAAACAVAGNIIDYAVNDGVSAAAMLDMIHSTMRALDMRQTRRLAADAARAARILYVCDNAGEIIFDSLLVRELGPEKITVCVRGKPAINDALADDAAAAGLDLLLDGRIIDTGEGVPGINLRPDSELCRALRDYDMLVAKGQGNFESLHGSDLHRHYLPPEVPVWFLFRVKCEHVARSAGIANGEPAMLREPCS